MRKSELRKIIQEEYRRLLTEKDVSPSKMIPDMQRSINDIFDNVSKLMAWVDSGDETAKKYEDAIMDIQDNAVRLSKSISKSGLKKVK